jgi:hypothetical protein
VTPHLNGGHHGAIDPHSRTLFPGRWDQRGAAPVVEHVLAIFQALAVGGCPEHLGKVTAGRGAAAKFLKKAHVTRMVLH